MTLEKNLCSLYWKKDKAFKYKLRVIKCPTLQDLPFSGFMSGAQTKFLKQKCGGPCFRDNERKTAIKSEKD